MSFRKKTLKKIHKNINQIFSSYKTGQIRNANTHIHEREWRETIQDVFTIDLHMIEREEGERWLRDDRERRDERWERSAEICFVDRERWSSRDVVEIQSTKVKEWR